MKFCKSNAGTLDWLSDFYAESGYGGTFDGADEVYYAADDNRVVAVVRVAQEHGVLVLRGMQVLPKLRGQHIGRKLLGYVEKYLSDSGAPCYCLPHQHLLDFYAAAGFLPVEPTSDTPGFLLQRQSKYTAQGLSIALLVRGAAGSVVSTLEQTDCS